MGWTMKEMGKRKIELFNTIVDAYSSKNKKTNKKSSKTINENKNKAKVNDGEKLKIKVGRLNHNYDKTLDLYWGFNTVRELIIENTETKSVDGSRKWEFKPKTTKDASIMEEYGISLIKKKKVSYLKYTYSEDRVSKKNAVIGQIACIFSIIAQRKENKSSNAMTTLECQCAIVFKKSKIYIFCTFSLVSQSLLSLPIV